MPKKKSVTKKENSAPVEVKKPLRSRELREEFRRYFVKLNRKLNLGRDMEEILWLHLKATGTNSPELFDRGIENFGYKL